jgi:hypothetical protein
VSCMDAGFLGVLRRKMSRPVPCKKKKQSSTEYRVSVRYQVQVG